MTDNRVPWLRNKKTITINQKGKCAMKSEIKILNREEPYVCRILDLIKEGKLNPARLSKKVRQDCVEVLAWEDVTPAQVALLLRKSEKTIRADYKEIKERDSKVEYLSRIDMKIVVGDNGPRTVWKSSQRFKRLPGEKEYKAVTRQIIEEEEN